jgi:DMSO/TMAO reductase YedYZ molybdopterin-dependent catalytic subunit
MTRRALTGLTISSFLSIPWLALNYAGYQLARLPLVPVELFELITRLLPGGVVTAGLETMISLLHQLNLGPTSEVGKTAEFIMAYLFTLVGLVLVGVLYAAAAGHRRTGWAAQGILAGMVLGALASLIAFWGGWRAASILLGVAWLEGISIAWGLGLAWGVAQVEGALSVAGTTSRRRALAQLGIGSLILAAFATGFGRWFARRPEEQLAAVETNIPTPSAPTPTPPPARTGFVPVEGTRPEITPINRFYRVDINLLPPGQEDFSSATDNLTRRLLAQGGETDLPAESYILILDGLFEEPLSLSLDAIRAFPRVDQYATLSCISNPVGGDLIGTTRFQGARLKDVLERAGLQPEATYLKFTCVDGYTESLPIESALHPETLLCYAMGDQPLTREHGSPIRLYTPDRFGMKNPKWIIRIEAIDEEYFGYWEQRGWSQDAWVKTTSVIDAAAAESGGPVEVGGIAFSGARGIQRVEVRSSDGDWIPAELNRPLSPLTWVLWRAEITLPPGAHEISVRAVDGTGEVQTDQRSDTHPDGASGHHQKNVEVDSG